MTRGRILQSRPPLHTLSCHCGLLPRPCRTCVRWWCVWQALLARRAAWEAREAQRQAWAR
jgi:hypothetical protein